jgi:hypothetical protein
MKKSRGVIWMRYDMALWSVDDDGHYEFVIDGEPQTHAWIPRADLKDLMLVILDELTERE